MGGGVERTNVRCDPGTDPSPQPTPARGGGECSSAGGQPGVNIGIGGPPSLGTNFSFTSWPIFNAARSQSTMLVIIVGPSASVT